MPITAGHPKDEPDVQIIENYKGIVQLNVFVNPQQAFIRAVELVRTVKRVKSVKNDIIVK
jgi:osmotically-inducible protein OsmY